MYDVRDETDNILLTMRIRAEDAVSDVQRLSSQHRNHYIVVRQRVDNEYRCIARFLNGARRGNLTLAEAVEKEEATYIRLKDEIEEGRENEARHWRFLDSDSSEE